MVFLHVNSKVYFLENPTDMQYIYNCMFLSWINLANVEYV